MNFIFAVFLILFCWGCLDYGMKRFAAWRRGGATGPTIIDHERRLKKEIGQYSEQHATVAWEKKAIDHFERTGKVLERPSCENDNSLFEDENDIIVNPAYSGLSSNIFHNIDDH